MNNIITFENNKYEWKTLAGYGNCLIPYKEPEFLPGLKEGDILDIWENDKAVGQVMVIRDWPNPKYSLLFLAGVASGQRIGSWLWKSLNELKKDLKNIYPNVKQVDPREVFKKLF